MSPAVFIDANVPIYAGGRNHPSKEPSARVLLMVVEHPLSGSLRGLQLVIIAGTVLSFLGLWGCSGGLLDLPDVERLQNPLVLKKRKQHVGELVGKANIVFCNIFKNEL